MSLAGKTIVVVGEVRSTEDLTVDGRIDGPVLCLGRSVTLARSADVSGDVVAADITVFGRASGQLIATEVVDLRPGAVATGVVIAPSLILHDGARFNGRVDPLRLDAALSVVHFQQKQRDASGAMR
jgi:cytoskeletal protein CcmA (bactofilin family)